jgi:DNA-binding protein Alba
MDKYKRVDNPKPVTEIQENEIRITTQGKMRSYIAYATNLFQKGNSEVILKAMGRAINKTVTIAEIIKRRS